MISSDELATGLGEDDAEPEDDVAEDDDKDLAELNIGISMWGLREAEGDDDDDDDEEEEEKYSNASGSAFSFSDFCCCCMLSVC